MTLEGLSQATSVTEVVRKHAARGPDRPAVAIVDDPSVPEGVGWWSWSELDVHAQQVGAWLQQHSAPGERVMLLYPNGRHFAAAFLGCLYAGNVALPAPIPRGHNHDLRRTMSIAENSGATVILTDQNSLDVVSEWANQVVPESKVVCTDKLDTKPGTCQIFAASRSTLAMLQYTSGSTSEPKGVMLTHGNLLANAASLCGAFDLDENTRFGGWLPNYHDMGLNLLLLPLLLGGSTALMHPHDFIKRPQLWLEMIGSLGVHFTAAPNFAYALCSQRVTDEQLEGIDLSGWRYAINGAEPVRADVLSSFAGRFANSGFKGDVVVPCYGMAEATVFVSGSPNRVPTVIKIDSQHLEANQFVPAGAGSTAVRKVVSCGAVHDFDVRIVDPTSQLTLGGRDVGEIWLRGDSIGAAYWNHPAATATTFGQSTINGEAGFLRTGDLGVVHEGELYVTGRIKEAIVIRGRNLYPQDIEQEVRIHHRELASGVGAVFTVPDGKNGDDSVVVTHELKESLGEDDLKRLARGVRQTVAREFGVRVGGVALVPAGGVRRTTSGKIERAAMRKLFVQRDLHTLHLDYDETLILRSIEER